MVHLEHAEPVQQAAAAVRERIEPCAQDHVLANTGVDRVFDRVLDEPPPGCSPTGETVQLLGGQLSPQLVGESRALESRELEGEGVVEDARRGALAVEAASHSRKDRCTAWIAHRNHGSIVSRLEPGLLPVYP
jgi:hypothetical protein